MVELFLLNDAGLYLEVELGPWGHHLVLLLDNGKDLRHSLPLAFSVTAREEGGSWKGKAVIPTSYLPPNISKLNAYAIHGHGDERKYEALFPAPQGVHKAPNFHRLEYFKPVEFRRIAYRPTELSPLWEACSQPLWEVGCGRRTACSCPLVPPVSVRRGEVTRGTMPAPRGSER